MYILGLKISDECTKLTVTLVIDLVNAPTSNINILQYSCCVHEIHARIKEVWESFGPFPPFGMCEKV